MPIPGTDGPPAESKWGKGEAMTSLPDGRSIFTTRELKDLGVGRHAVSTLASSGRLHRITRGLFTTGRPTGDVVLRALAHQKPYVVVTGMTAVQLRRKMRVSTPVSVLVPRNREFGSNSLVAVIRADHRPSEIIDGIRVATPLRTALDVPEKVDQYAVREIERRYRGRQGMETLEEDLMTWKKVPSRLRERIRRASIGADSETERMLFRALKERGYTFEHNVLLGHYFRDGVHEPSKVVVEVNGRQFHRDLNAVVKDYWKANDAMARGYRHLTFSDVCIDLHLNRVVDMIIAVIEGQPCEVDLVGQWHSAWTQPHAIGLP